MDYGVVATGGEVVAWSSQRLAFEPRGWQKSFRAELRDAVRSLEPGAGSVLVAEYDAAGTGFADLENVLLYNIGSGAYSHLCGRGIICRRGHSVDGRHHVRYRVVENGGDSEPFTTEPLGKITRDLGLRIPSTVTDWWAHLRRTGRLRSKWARESSRRSPPIRHGQ